MRPIKTLILTVLLAATLAPFVQAQSISILQPIQNATIWGNQVTVRWTSDDIDITEANGTSNESGAHYHLFFSQGRRTDLDLTPGQPIGDEAIHTTQETHTYTNLSGGTYTLHIALADGNHVPLEPSVQASVQFTIRPPDERPTAEIPNWLLVVGVGVLLLGAVLLTQTI